MKPHHLSLVAASIVPTVAIAALQVPPAAVLKPSSDRKVFWKAYLDWLSTASDDEAEQLDRVLAQHAHHVRPLVVAISDAIHDPATASHLPGSLLAELYAAGWQPLPSTLQRAA